MVEVEVGARYLCRDGHVRRVGRDWGSRSDPPEASPAERGLDGTITWVMNAPPVIADEIVGTCTPEAFAAMAVERLGEA